MEPIAGWQHMHTSDSRFLASRLPREPLADVRQTRSCQSHEADREPIAGWRHMDTSDSRFPASRPPRNPIKGCEPIADVQQARSCQSHEADREPIAGLRHMDTSDSRFLASRPPRTPSKGCEPIVDVQQSRSCQPRDPDKDWLYGEIHRVELQLIEQQKFRAETEASLRAEVAKLSTEVGDLQVRAAECRRQAEIAGEEADRMAEQRQEQDVASRKQLQLAARAAEASLRLASQAQRLEDSARESLTEESMMETSSKVHKAEWEAAVAALQKTAAHVESLENVRVNLTAQTFKLAQLPGVRNSAESEQAAALLSEKRALQKEVQKCKDARELKMLVDDERRDIEGMRSTSNSLLAEIAKLDRNTDAVDRRCQVRIQELKSALEKVAIQEAQLKRARCQVEDWVQATRSALSRQQQAQLTMHQKAKEEDLFAAHLHARVDMLVEELKELEQNLRRQGESPFGFASKSPEPQTPRREPHARAGFRSESPFSFAGGVEEPVASFEAHTTREPYTSRDAALKLLSATQQQQRNSRRDLARGLGRRHLLQEELVASETEQSQLLKNLEPTRNLLGHVT